MRDKRLLEAYVREAILSELKISSDWKESYSNLWKSIKDSTKSLFDFEKEDRAVEKGEVPAKASNVSSEIDSALEDIETFYDKKINPGVKKKLRQDALEIYKKYVKKGSTEQDAINKVVKFLQLQVSRMSV